MGAPADPSNVEGLGEAAVDHEARAVDVTGRIRREKGYDAAELGGAAPAAQRVALLDRGVEPCVGLQPRGEVRRDVPRACTR